MNELIQIEEQLKSKKKRMETMESLISNREQQIDTLREMNKSLQEEKDMVFHFFFHIKYMR
jgi:DNA repair exonuclease SbcCD ATPase subunit